MKKLFVFPEHDDLFVDEFSCAFEEADENPRSTNGTELSIIRLDRDDIDVVIPLMHASDKQHIRTYRTNTRKKELIA